MICSDVYPFLAIYSPFYEIITGIVLGGQVTLLVTYNGTLFWGQVTAKLIVEVLPIFGQLRPEIHKFLPEHVTSH